MTPFSPTDALDPVQAYDRLATFAQRYGRLPLRLAMHAAVPQGFRLDLLHLLKLNFVPEAANDTTVEADLILAGICRDLGDGYFEFDPEVRRLLLDSLVDTYSGESPSRLRRVANFLLRYLEQLKLNPYDHKKRLRREYLEIQRWVALGFLNPEQAAYQLAAALDQAETVEDVTVRVRLGGLASVLSTPLVQHDRLLTYAVGLQALETGHYEQAQALLAGLGEQEISVGDIRLRSPATILQEWRRQHPPAQTLEPTSVDLETEFGDAELKASETVAEEPVEAEAGPDAPLQPSTAGSFRVRLMTNLDRLKKRVAAFGETVPSELLHRIEAYVRALDLFEEALAQNLPAAEIQARLAPLDLGITFDLTKRQFPSSFGDLPSAQAILLMLHENLNLLREREARFGSLEAPLGLLNLIYDYQQAIDTVEQAIERKAALDEIKELLTFRDYDISAYATQIGPEPIDFRQYLRQLEQNLNALRERETGYQGTAPLHLLNQIEDHQTALALTQQLIAGEITAADWRDSLKPLMVSAPADNLSSPAQPNEDDQPESVKGKVLIVDDDERWRDILTRLFRLRGYEDVIEAEDISTASKLLEENQVDIVTTGMHFGDNAPRAGETLLELISTKYPHIACIMISGGIESFAQIDDLKDKDRLDAFIHKTELTPEALDKAIERATEAARKRREQTSAQEMTASSSQIQHPPRAVKPPVLLLDSDSEWLELYRRELPQIGYTLETTGSQAEALERLAVVHHPVVISDLRLIGIGDQGGFELLDRIKTISEYTKIIIITAYGGTATNIAREAMEKGAMSYFTKPLDFNELDRAIVKAIQTWRQEIETMINLGLLEAGPELAYLLSDDVPIEALTRREVDVLKLIAQGYTNRQTAEALNISVRTVESHRANLMNKLNLGSRVDLIRYAKEYFSQEG